MLDRLVTHNDRIPLTSHSLTRFHSRAPPAISVHDYLMRILKYTQLEPTPLLAILIYIDRACSRRPGFTVSSLTVHRFLISAVTVSAKAWCDSYCTNTHYAKVGGVAVQELNALELELLFMIGWRLSCDKEALQRYYVNLTDQHPNFQRLEAADDSMEVANKKPKLQKQMETNQ